MKRRRAISALRSPSSTAPTTSASRPETPRVASLSRTSSTERADWTFSVRTATSSSSSSAKRAIEASSARPSARTAHHFSPAAAPAPRRALQPAPGHRVDLGGGRALEQLGEKRPEDLEAQDLRLGPRPPGPAEQSERPSKEARQVELHGQGCLLYTSPSPRDG